MSFTLLGTKLGMTRRYTEDGRNVPVTVIRVEPNVVTQIRTPEKDGYAAVQIGYGEMKSRRATMARIGHDAKAGAAPLRRHREFHVSEEALGEYQLGQELTVDRFASHAYVDVTATSKGKGFQGVMKRHNFAGLEASHGVERKHRSAGSISSHASNLGTGPKLKKGKRMAGQMGNERVTVRSLDVVHIDAERGLLLVKGPVPGHNKCVVEIRTPSRLYASKAGRQREAMAG